MRVIAPSASSAPSTPDLIMSDNYLHQVGLQWSLDLKAKQEAKEVFNDPITEALIDAGIAWETELLNADKFYDC